ncbi:metalloregulator ArsR/SmtB family transcription factor [Rhodocytophaga aerolata]|uniref:Metalloregulator ArsR/SmtB family transcription factor n=1 Tax=Rhodocytophaga aerolata TaxID=455078 RepID=A0ABT8R126_9BACT|nr:metalloregulator ArsR/SmtB family transcription factor [Rhodocytophaga aerolata]MDO1445361.1 metalloregulator ArsR/SmtB family transcription factor [Rhodocytophaga aerolata]
MRLKHFNITFGSQIFKAFSEESRIRIIYLLYNNEEMCISDIEHILDFTQAKTSRHLIYLKNAGLLGFKKVDQWAYYYLKEEVKDIVQQIFQYLGKDPVLLNDQETYRILYSNRELAICKRHQHKWSGGVLKQ